MPSTVATGLGLCRGRMCLRTASRTHRLSRETNPTLDLVFDRIHPEERDRIEQIREHAVKNCTHFDVEHRIVLPDGTIKYIRAVVPTPEETSRTISSTWA
jgi:hypothetical protein